MTFTQYYSDQQVNKVKDLFLQFFTKEMKRINEWSKEWHWIKIQEKRIKIKYFKCNTAVWTWVPRAMQPCTAASLFNRAAMAGGGRRLRRFWRRLAAAGEGFDGFGGGGAGGCEGTRIRRESLPYGSVAL